MAPPSLLDYGVTFNIHHEYEVQADAEFRELYEENRYCPLRIGQILDGRYRIEHKIGWGGYSTVWLARDSRSNTAVALKVASSGSKGNHELSIQNEIVRKAGPAISQYLVTYQRAFSIKGLPGHVHTVFVLPFRGPSLDKICRTLPRTFRVPAAKGLLLSLKCLHEFGIVHSDINAGAAMWDIQSIDDWSTERIYERFGRPKKVLDEEEGGGELVATYSVPQDMLRPSLHLGDFGNSHIYGTPVNYPIQFPYLYCAPERYHGMDPSFASDMWSFTCLLFKLHVGIEITYGDGSLCISRLVCALGPFPSHWKGLSPDNWGDKVRWEWWYDQTRTMGPNQNLGNSETMEAKIDRMRPDISHEEREHLLAVVRRGFEYMPEKRITAAEMLEDPSFNALMAYYEG